MQQTRPAMLRQAKQEFADIKRELIAAHKANNIEAWHVQLNKTQLVIHHLNMIMLSCDEASHGYVSNPSMRHTMASAAGALEAIITSIEELQIEAAQSATDSDARVNIITKWTNLVIEVGRVILSPPIPSPRASLQ